MTLEPEQVVQDRYRIVSRLGEGGMGAVYLAWDLRLKKAAALKEMVPQPGLDPQMLSQFRDQFEREAVMLASLEHPHLVRVSDCFPEGDRAYLVMEFVEGESLADRISREGAMSEAQVVKWAEQLLDALAYCHSHGIFHRDVKPRNIIISSLGDAVLVDFGLVKLWDPDDPHTKTAMRGMGTPGYAPPEQYGAKSGYTDERSDIYSLGATLYHALTGEAPPAVTDRVANPEQFRPPHAMVPGLSRRTESAIVKAVELNRNNRWQTTAEMAQALGVSIPRWPPRTAVARESTEVLPYVTRPLEEPRGRGKMWIVGAALLVLALMVGGGWAISRIIPNLGFGAGPAPGGVKSGADEGVVATVTPTPTRMLKQEPTPTSTASPTREPTATATTAAPPTSTPASSPEPTSTTPPATATSAPAATATSAPVATATSAPIAPPQIVSPNGTSSGNPVTFVWNGALGAGQSFRVVAVHVESNYTAQSDALTSTMWTTDLPAERFGEWRWSVEVLENGDRVVASDPATLWLSGIGGGSSDNGEPTNTPPAP